MTDSPPPQPTPRWYLPTPDRFLVALLPAVGLLWLSERYRWFPFNEHKNWTVLITIAVVGGAMALLLLWLGVSLVFRRRFQFGIRSLLVLTLVVAVVGSWFTVRMGRARRQKEAVAALQDVQWYICYDYEFDADGTFVKSATPPGPAWLQNLLGVDFLPEVTSVYLQSDLPSVKGANDNVLCHLSALTSLRFVNLWDPSVTDVGLAHLEGLTNLEYVGLRDTQVTDAGLVHVEGLTNLERLDLPGTQVTDAGLVHLGVLVKLTLLNLNDTQITDAGLVHVEGLTNLEFLYLEGTQITDAGVQRLQKTLPNCVIIR